MICAPITPSFAIAERSVPRRCLPHGRRLPLSSTLTATRGGINGALEQGGIHHLTAITAQAQRNVDFYTRVLGMRLIKKTVNQDDDQRLPPVLRRRRRLARRRPHLLRLARRSQASAATTKSAAPACASPAEADLSWWKEHLAEQDVASGSINGARRPSLLDFEDFEGQRFRLIADPKAGPGHPWDKSPIPAEHQILGLGPITLSVPELSRTANVLTQVMNMREVRTYPAREKHGEIHVFEMGRAAPRPSCMSR